MEYVHRFFDFMRPHWSAAALVATWVGIAFVAARRRLQWWRKQFLAQVNFSLNYAAGGQLAMRTLLETTANKVWLNEYGVGRVFKAAAQTTVDNPFLVMKDPQDRDFVNRAVLNTLSERFAEAFVATALGERVVKGTFYFGVTCEKYEDIRTVKLRVLLVEARALEELFGPERNSDKLEVRNPVYRARLATLRVMYDLYAKDKASGQPLLGRVELGVVLPRGGPGDEAGPACGASGSARAD